jgi:FkbM family methyltransferase
MNRLQKISIALRCRNWTRWGIYHVLLRLASGRLRFLRKSAAFNRHYEKVSVRMFAELSRKIRRKWLVRKGDATYFDICGAKLPDLSKYPKEAWLLAVVFQDTFLMATVFNDCYDKSIVGIVDKYMGEGPYGYTDGAFDVTVRAGDVVCDVGAWIGDYSAYAASKGATVYAFEPVKAIFDRLCETATLNETGKIIPVQKGLGKEEGRATISIEENNSGGGSIVIEKGVATEQIMITTLDQFVEENNLARIDFIKADIEGAERDMLRGATNVLKTFAPKLAICTYHFPDDPEVLERIIKEANPAYQVVHLRHKLFAAVIANP